jgi:hypothetical protein
VDFFGDDFLGDVIHQLTLVNDQGHRLTSRFTVQLPDQSQN